MLHTPASNAPGEPSPPQGADPAPPAPPVGVGTIVGECYRLDALLGHGRLGPTYNAWHTRKKSATALTLLQRRPDPAQARLVQRDLRALQGLLPLGFVTSELHAGGATGPFLATELLVGTTLRARLSQGPLRAPSAGLLILSLGRALEAAHRVGVVHGDVRPERVFLPTAPGRHVPAGQPVLLGAALHHLRPTPTPAPYRPPEEVAGSKRGPDAATDGFALGALLHECLSGHPPASPPGALVLPPQAEPQREPLQAALQGLIAQACAVNPGDRFADLAGFLGALEQAYAAAGLVLVPGSTRGQRPTPAAPGRGATVVQRRGRRPVGPAPAASASGASWPTAQDWMTLLDGTAPAAPAPTPTKAATMQVRLEDIEVIDPPLPPLVSALAGAPSSAARSSPRLAATDAAALYAAPSAPSLSLVIPRPHLPLWGKLLIGGLGALAVALSVSVASKLAAPPAQARGDRPPSRRPAAAQMAALTKDPVALSQPPAMPKEPAAPGEPPLPKALPPPPPSAAAVARPAQRRAGASKPRRADSPAVPRALRNPFAQ